MDNQSKTLKYLQNVHAVENGACEMLENMSNRDDLPFDSRTTLTNGLAEGKQRIGVLEQHLKAQGSDSSGTKDWLTGAMSKVGDWMHNAMGSDEVETQDLIKVHSATHMLHASYCALNSFCRATGDTQTAQLGQQFAQQCESFAQKVIPLVETAAAQSANGSPKENWANQPADRMGRGTSGSDINMPGSRPMP